MVRLIVRTLELNLKFPTSSKGLGAPFPYADFVKLLVQLTEQAKPAHSVAVLTFNYDAALDFAIESGARRVFYGLDGAPPEGQSITLLKLHGSVNWFACSGTDDHTSHVQVWPVCEAIKHAKQLPETDVGTVRYSMNFSQFQVCGRPAEAPLIVPPTWSKGEHYRQLGPVWQRAALELSEAENILVIGYSLPPSDGFFPLLFGLGTVGDTPIRRFWVFDPDEAVGTRFSAMLGSGARQRFQPFHEFKRFQSSTGREIPDPVTFQSAIVKLREEFKIR